MKSIILESLDELAPYKQIKLQTNRPGWITPTLLEALNDEDNYIV